MKKHLWTICLFFVTTNLLYSQEYWSKRYDIEFGNEYGSQIIAQEDGFLVFMWGFCGLVNPDFCNGIIKFDLEGEKQWQSLMYDTIGPNAYMAMAIRNDTIFVNTDYKTKEGCSVLAYDMQGSYLGRHDYWHPTVPYSLVARTIKSKGERLFVNFSYKDTLENRGKYKTRVYDAAWNQLWEVKLPDNTLYPKIAYADMDACADGGIVTACVSYMSVYKSVCTIQKYDANGNKVWTTLLDGIYENSSVPASIQALPDGGCMGHWTISDWDVFLLYPFPDIWFKLDADGQIVWQKIDERKTQNRNFINTFVAKNGDLIGCGYGSDSPYDTIDDPHRNYANIARIKPDGQLRWARRIYETKDGGYYPTLYHGAELENGDLIFTGYVWDTIQTPQNPSWDDLWLLKLDSNGCFSPGCDDYQFVLPAYEPAQAVQLDAFTTFPNPCSEQFTLAAKLGKSLPDGDYHLALFDASGRVILKEAFNPNLLKTVTSRDLMPGLYTLVIFRNGMETQTLKVVKQ